MRRLCAIIVGMRKLIVGVVVLVLLFVGVYVAAGYSAGPSVSVASPEKFVGLSTPLDVVVKAPGARVSALKVEFEQRGTRTSLFSFAGQGAITADSSVTTDGGDTLHVKRTIGREAIKGLQSGKGRIIVTASRPVVFGLRRIQTSAAHDVEVRLERPKLSALSTKHYINQGGSEMVVYRVTPADAVSGVMVGNVEYPGYPASSVAGVDGVSISGPDVRVAFFALRYDQDANTPIKLYGRDPAGNTGTADFDHLTFAKKFKNSTIPIEDKFLDRVVPAILEGTSDVRAGSSNIESFLAINGELRKKNGEKIASMAAQTAPEMLWKGVVFHPFTNTAVESAFADRRTYVYQGKNVDQQTHLGFDLASFANTPIVAANRGKVLFADNLGIYGNCVIMDHGMGVQSLYAHLSSIDVKVGDIVEKEAQIGRSGMTGMAGGDHLHFTMLVNGHMVNPIEWWDKHWLEDRILRKLREAK
jgi:murein DD-endopeptidase MepM/ murein hydrolase activator NlpD